MIPIPQDREPPSSRSKGWRFSIAWLFLITTAIALSTYVLTSVIQRELAPYMAPGVITICLLLVATIHPCVKKAPFLAGAVLCLATLFSPMALDWYTRNVLQDHTANIGLGMLLMGLPVLAPIAALCGVLPVGGLIGLLHWNDSEDS